MTKQRSFFNRPRLWGLLGGLTLAVAQFFIPAGASIHAPMRTVRRLTLRLLLALTIVLNIGIPKAQPAYADTQTAHTDIQAVLADTPGCSLTNGCPPATTFPPPELLYLKQGGLYAATAAQAASLRNLENQAIEIVLALHGLPAADDAAVRTWGRDDVLAQLFILLVTAIGIDAADRTSDQQNAVDWVTTVAQRRQVATAQSAAREYVKWGALGLGDFDTLLHNNPTKAQLEAFLSRPVLNYDLPTVDATEGWCVYRSPAPYADEYQGYNVPTCVNQVIGVVLPPTPTYDEFVKWGAAKTNYPLLSNQAYLTRAQTLGIALGVLLPLAAIIAGYVPYSVAAAAVATEAAFAVIGQSVEFTSIFGATTSFLVGTGVALVSTILVAVAAAIILGINVTDAANLPGKLATLIDTAKNTPPDAATLVSSTDATTSLLGLFVGATTPTPKLESCDNTKSLAPGMYETKDVTADAITLISSTPCLNPTAIPAATATDLQFLVAAKNTGSQTLAPSIQVKNGAVTTTARLSGTWFVTTANGTTAQTMRLAYTDWNRKQQNAWLIGNPTDGYSFLTYAPPADVSTTVDPETCVTNGTCGAGPSINYIGADGQPYSASVQPYQPPTGTPTIIAGAEGSPLTLKANNFAPGGAVAPVTYQWLIKAGNCNFLSCPTVTTLTGDTVNYTWQAGGAYRVDLVATDKVGAQATTTLQVSVSSLPPTLTFAPTCSSAPTVPCNQWDGQLGNRLLRATIEHAGTEDRLDIIVNWGDGVQETAQVSKAGQAMVDSTMKVTAAASGLAYSLEAPHNYTNNGVYTGTVTVKNVLGLSSDGGTVVRPFTMVVGTGGLISPPFWGYAVSAWGGNGAGQLNLPAGLYALAVAGGSDHSLALKNDGTVVAWGCKSNFDHGQCSVPAGLRGVKAIAAGGSHSLALKNDGTVVAWSCPAPDNRGQCAVPAGLTGVISIATSQWRSLALKNDGTVVSWGCEPSDRGQCTVPAGLSGVKALAAGYYHTLALKNDGTVVAWGCGSTANYGQCTIPAGLNNVVAIAANTYHSLALKSDGAVVAWGDNRYGAITVPAGLREVVAISAGVRHSLALKGDGAVVSWGCVGANMNNGQCTTPAGLSGVTAISAGGIHNLVLRNGPATEGAAGGVVAAADTRAGAESLDAAQPLTTTEVAAAPAVVEAPAPDASAPDTSAQAQRLFLPLIANLATMATSADVQPASVAALVVTTTTLAVATALVTPTQPLSPLAAPAPVTPTLPITAATAPVLTASVPVSTQTVVTTRTVAAPAGVTTTQPVTTAPVDTTTTAATAPTGVENGEQSQNLFLPIITNVSNLAGAALGSAGGVGMIVLLALVIGSLVWQRRRGRDGR